MDGEILRDLSKINDSNNDSTYKNILLEMIVADFATDLIVFRKRFGISQSELAKMMDLSEEMIDKLEKGFM